MRFLPCHVEMNAIFLIFVDQNILSHLDFVILSFLLRFHRNLIFLLPSFV